MAQPHIIETLAPSKENQKWTKRRPQALTATNRKWMIEEWRNSLPHHEILPQQIMRERPHSSAVRDSVRQNERARGVLKRHSDLPSPVFAINTESPSLFHHPATALCILSWRGTPTSAMPIPKTVTVPYTVSTQKHAIDNHRRRCHFDGPQMTARDSVHADTI